MGKNNKILKTAIIGLGQIGYKIDEDPLRKLIWSHAKTYKTHSKTSLEAVSDIDKTNYDDFNKIYPNIDFYDDYSKMIKDVDLDIVSICTPTTPHLNIVRNIVKSNPPQAIFIEKPMGQNLTEAMEISKLCEKNDIVLAVNYMRRWDNKYKVIKNIIDCKEFGELQSIVTYGCTALLTSSSHLIDLMLFFGGKIKWLVGVLQEDYIRMIQKDPDPGGK